MLLSTGKCSQSWLHTGAIKGARDQVSSSSGWPQASYVAETSLELLLLLPLLSKAWHYRCALSHLARQRMLGPTCIHYACLSGPSISGISIEYRRPMSGQSLCGTGSAYLAPGYWSAHPYPDVAHSRPDHYGNGLQKRPTSKNRWG